MFLRPFLASIISVSMAAGAVVVPTTAHARAPSPVVGLSVTAPEEAAVLGLDGSDSDSAGRLTTELRNAFGRRGLGGSEELSLAEVRLTMGCEGNDEACLSEAGKSIGVRRLIYGDLQASGDGGYNLTLHILNVPEAVEETTTVRPLGKGSLSPANITATATEIVDSLFPKEDGPEPLETSTPADPLDPPDEGQPRDDPSKSGLVWGGYKPRPTWKWAGFGIGVSLLVVGVAGIVGTGVAVNNYQQDALDAADRSLTDCVIGSGPTATVVACENPMERRFVENDVDPNVDGDLCAIAGQTGTDPDNPDAVVNSEVHDACSRGDTAEKLNYASFAVGGVGLLLTAVFTTLLFVHKENPGANAMRRRGVQFSAGPNPSGGISVGGGFRF